MKKILCDTDVLIDYLRGKESVKPFIDKFQIIYISSMTIAELYSGVRKGKKTKQLAEFIKTFEVVNINQNIAELGGKYCNQYKPSHGTGLADALIAATVTEIDAQLISYNTKHYPMLKDIIKPPKD